MTDSAWRWAALNLRLAGRPGLRQKLLGREEENAGRPRALELALQTLGPAWQEAAHQEIERARRFGASILTLEDPGYPPLLRVTSDPPPLLYVWGRLQSEDVLGIAVVGSRRATPYGIQVARRIAGDLAGQGFTVVSGLARGIDAASHCGALGAGGRTLALLGSGLDRIYPAEHQRLAEAIASQGAVLSEFPFGTPPLKQNFPERNRVIAGIAWATVVVEAARDSGSLITAGLAADEGRAVYAVPGPVDEKNAEGTNGLLRDGALVCRSAGDVIEDLAPQVAEAAGLLARRGPASPAAGPAQTAGLTPAQRRVLEAIPKTRGIGIDTLGETCGLAPGPLLATLLDLELLGLVRQIPGRRFVAAACKI